MARSKSTPVAPGFTGKTLPNWGCFRIALCMDLCQDSLIGKERMSQSVGVSK
jgi:hypothetical protein